MAMPVLRGLWAWAWERFPPVVYTVLVALFWGSGARVATALGGGGRLAPAAAVVVLLVFLHLRIMDEHKDYDRDVITHPDRVLSRGLVTLPVLARLGVLAVAVEALVAASLGGRAFAWWAATFAFTLSMRFDHDPLGLGIRPWLERHMAVMAFTHNPVVVPLALFVHASTGAPWRWGYLWFAALSSAGLLAFEFGRKTRRPEEEIPGVPSYTSTLGQRGARALLAGVYAGLGIALAGLALALGRPPLVAALAAVLVPLPGLLTCPGRQPAKRVEGAASAVLLLAFLAAAWLAG